MANLKISVWDVKKMLGLTTTNKNLYIHEDVTESMLTVHQECCINSDIILGERELLFTDYMNEDSTETD